MSEYYPGTHCKCVKNTLCKVVQYGTANSESCSSRVYHLLVRLAGNDRTSASIISSFSAVAHSFMHQIMYQYVGLIKCFSYTMVTTKFSRTQKSATSY